MVIWFGHDLADFSSECLLSLAYFRFERAVSSITIHFIYFFIEAHGGHHRGLHRGGSGQILRSAAASHLPLGQDDGVLWGLGVVKHQFIFCVEVLEGVEDNEQHQ